MPDNQIHRHRNGSNTSAALICQHFRQIAKGELNVSAGKRGHGFRHSLERNVRERDPRGLLQPLAIDVPAAAHAQ